jgi:hypothetical protein
MATRSEKLKKAPPMNHSTENRVTADKKLREAQVPIRPSSAVRQSNSRFPIKIAFIIHKYFCSLLFVLLVCRVKNRQKSSLWWTAASFSPRL